MPRIKRSTYHKATVSILNQSGFNTRDIKLGYILAEKNDVKLCLCINGKNLPYLNKSGKEIFPWETHIKPFRLDEAKKISSERNAESWFGFIYAILKPKYEKYFKVKVKIVDTIFGLRMIKTEDYIEKMEARSPSFGNVQLQRNKVVSLTQDPSSLQQKGNYNQTRHEINQIKQKSETVSTISLPEIITFIADSLVEIDSSGIPHKRFQPGVGPYGEPQLVKKIAEILNENDRWKGLVKTKRTPDMLIRGHWALEFKIARPFGDNGREAENWSVNLLHPYPGNTSSLGDCMKLLESGLTERKAVVVVGYEHNPPLLSLETLVKGFELLAKDVVGINIGPRIMENRKELIHPIHQQLTVYAWEVLQ